MGLLFLEIPGFSCAVALHGYKSGSAVISDFFEIAHEVESVVELADGQVIGTRVVEYESRG